MNDNIYGMNNQQLADYYERKGKRNCDKDKHTIDVLILQHPVIGGVLGWRCHCGSHTEGRATRTPVADLTLSQLQAIAKTPVQTDEARALLTDRLARSVEQSMGVEGYHVSHADALSSAERILNLNK